MILDDLIYCSARAHQVDRYLLKSIIIVESAKNEKAMRYEANYHWISNPQDHAARLGITLDTETHLQMFSYGLCQLMGGLLRDMGFEGMLTDALGPGTNIDYGARHIANLLQAYPKMEDAVSAYNAGSPAKQDNGQYVNQAYVNKVMSRYASVSIGL